MNDPTSGAHANHAAPGPPPFTADLGQIRAITDHLPLLAWSCLPDGHCDYLSRGWVEYTGTPEADHHGRGWLDAIHPDDRDRTRDGWEAFVAGAAPYDVEYRIRRHDGAYRWFKTRGVLARDATGRPVRVLGTTTDIDAQKRAEDALREASATLRGFYDTAPVMMGVVEIRGDDLVHLTDNAATHRFFGAAPDALAGRRASELGVAPEHLAEWVRRYREADRTGRPVRFEYPHQTAGGVRWVSAIVSRIEALPGGSCRCSYVAEDATDRREADDRLRRAEERLRAMIDNWPSVIFVKDREGRYLLANKACAALVGEPPDRMVGKTDYDYLPAAVADRFRADDRRVLETGEILRYEEEAPVGDRVLTSLTIKFPLRDAAGRPYAVCGIATDISDRKRAEDALRASEGRLRAMIDSWPSIIFVKDWEGRYLLANKACRTYSGVPPEEMVGKTDFDLLPHEYAARYREDDLRVLRSGQPERYEEEAPIEGVPTAFLTIKFPLRDANGRVYAACGIATDVTDLKRAERALRETEARFRQLADAMPQIVWTAGPDGQIDYLNRRWVDFSGQPAAVGNAGWGPLLHPDEAAPAHARWAESVRSGVPFEMELRLRDRRDGSYRWHLIRTVAARDEGGRVARWFGTATDIDGQKRAEASSRYLAEASAVLAGVVDYESTLQRVANLSVPYFADWAAVDVADIDGGLRRLAVAHENRAKVALAHELMRDYPPDPAAPTGSYAVLRAGRAEHVAEITDDMLVRGARDEKHLGLLRSLGLESYICVPLVVSGTPLGVLTFVTAESGRRYTEADLVLATDLAHRAAVAVENTRLYQALRDADRRKDEFLATLAHELRNPLAPIRNGLQVMRLAGGSGDTAERARAMMERQVAQMVRLVDDLLDLSRISRGKIELRKERVELARVIHQAVETSRPLIDAGGHDLAVDLPPHPVYVDADVTRLAQVFSNLLNNAAKYTERGGRIRLAAEHRDHEAVVSVRDTGVGIPAHMLPHVFEMFTQVDRTLERSQGGLGIGLSIVKRLVEMHGGAVAATSDGHGAGSEFVVRLPVVLAVVPPPEGAAEAPRLSARRRVLVADDNVDAAESLAMMLDLMGCEARTAHDGVEALAVAAEFRPDLILLDIGMPRLNGYDTARRVRGEAWGRGVVLVALTGWGQDDDRRRSREAGFDAHMTKPIEPAALGKLLAGLQSNTA